MWIEPRPLGCTLLLALYLALCTCASAQAQDTGQYRSRILLDPLGEIGVGSEMSVQELEQQIDAITDPYARSSATRHLARHYVAQKNYPAAIDWYRQALEAEGLSAVANREMLRELARVYLLDENFPAAADALEQALAIDLVPAAADYLLLGQARYRQGDYVAVVAALDSIQARGLTLDTAQKRQALALYYRVGAYEQCEGLLRQLLEDDPREYSYWHQLASVYLQQDKRRAALDQLVLAMEKGVPFSDAELLLLVDLLAANGNPYGAAHLLLDAMDADQLARDAANQRKLFELWFQARERDRAKSALARAVALGGDTELSLYLAQLQMEDEAWSAVQATLLAACEQRLEDRYVSRANLLLGISLLKQGREEGARRMLLNATLVGGANQQAARWLQFMEARAPTEDELRRVRGPCYGTEGVRAAIPGEPARMASIGVNDPRGEDSSPVESHEGQSVPVHSEGPRRFFYVEADETMPDLLPQLRSRAPRLGVSLVRAGGTRDGPLHLLDDGDGKRKLAFPVRGSVQPKGRYRVYAATEFRYVALTLKPGQDIAADIEALSARARRAGLSPTGHVRLVVQEDEPGIELQLGVQ